MRLFHGKTLDWSLADGVLLLELHRPPLNEIGSATLLELEQFVQALAALEGEARTVVVRSALEAGFCAGAGIIPKRCRRAGAERMKENGRHRLLESVC